MDAVRAGMGIAAMSEWSAGPYLGGDLVIKRLASGPLMCPWRIAFRRGTEVFGGPYRRGAGGLRTEDPCVKVLVAPGQQFLIRVDLNRGRAVH